MGVPSYSDSTILRFALTLAIAFALGTNVIAQHDSEDEIFLGCETVERLVDHHPYGLDTFRLSKKQVHAFTFAHRLKQIGDMLAFYALNNGLRVTVVESKQNHSSHTLLIFVDVIHEHFEYTGSMACLTGLGIEGHDF